MAPPEKLTPLPKKPDPLPDRLTPLRVAGDSPSSHVCQRCVRSLARNNQVLITESGSLTCNTSRGPCDHCRSLNLICVPIPKSCIEMTRFLIRAGVCNWTIYHQFSRGAIQAMARQLDAMFIAADQRSKEQPANQDALHRGLAQLVEATRRLAEVNAQSGGIRLPSWSPEAQLSFDPWTMKSDSIAVTSKEDGKDNFAVYARDGCGQADRTNKLEEEHAGLIRWDPTKPFQTTRSKRKLFAVPEPEGAQVDKANTTTTPATGNGDNARTTTDAEAKKQQKKQKPNWTMRLPGSQPPFDTLMCVNDNFDTDCSFVERAAEQRAVAEIDHLVTDAVRIWKNAAAGSLLKEETGMLFPKESINRWAGWIPEPYKQTVGGLNETQRTVYEEFDRTVRGMNAGHLPNASLR
ncbi:hypothetical protein CLAIMM_14775 [Cladophialophora immunda]|nr:hypothetical protein CLAIMM_14775 [Cladophialophora immunda]